MLHTRPTIEDSIILATQLHKGQVDKSGVPYIYHPLRVMLMLEREEERMAGVLHDVVEDTDMTFEKLRERGYSTEVLDALRAVTKTPEEEDNYDAFINRILRGPTLGIKVKLADLADNLDPTRQAGDPTRRAKRQAKYRRAQAILKEELVKRIHA